MGEDGLSNTPTPFGHASITDADRERFMDALRRAVGYGFITLEQCSARFDAVIAAQNPTELDAIIADLPQLKAELLAEEQSLQLNITQGKLIKRGYWTIPAQLKVSATRSRVVLDFSQARFVSPLTNLELDFSRTGAVFIVPVDMEVSVDQLSLSQCHLVNKTRALATANRRIIIHGKSATGSIDIIYPPKNAITKLWRALGLGAE